MVSISKVYSAGKASVHVEDCARFYSEPIQRSINETSVFGPKLNPVSASVGKPDISIVDCDTVSKIIGLTKSQRGRKICALNFANYTTPGGGYLRGATAQEEDLCRDSFLYNVLESQGSYYRWNREHLVNGLYADRALYSPNIMFGLGEDRDAETVGLADILTCALPRVTRDLDMIKNERFVYNRIGFVKNILAIKKPDIFIAGAWGCGAFKQDPKMIAEDFKEIFGKDSPVRTIIFAIPKSRRNKNYEIFQEVFANNSVI